MNFILDVGNVLVEYMPFVYLRGLFSDDSLVEKMYTTIFDSPEWLHMDKGILTHDEATCIFCKREPEYQQEIHRVMQSVNEMFIQKTDSIEVLLKTKEMGHGVYYLSNIHKEIRDYLLKNHDYFRVFDGGVFSCDINFIKPSPEIYRHLLDKYHLNPHECLFFDDMEQNVSAAEKEGIKSVLFTTADCVLDFL